MGVFGALLGLMGVGSSQQPAEPPIQTIDPRTIYFSMSTIANDQPPLDRSNGGVTDRDMAMHEDEWRQTEFLPASRLGEVQLMLEELARFEAANRHGQVFRNVYVRDFPPRAVLPDAITPDTLARELGAAKGPAPVLFSAGGGIVGRATDGFSILLGSNVWLYGYRSAEGILVLGGDVGHGGDHALLTRAFMQLSRNHGLIAVDWRAHRILTGVTSGGQIETWRPD